MNIFGLNITRAKSQPDTLEDIFQKAASSKRLGFRYMNGNYLPYETKIDTIVKEGYLKNPHVKAVVSYVLEKATSVPWGTYKVKNQKALKQYKLMTGPGATATSIINARIERFKALEEVVEDSPYAIFLTRPNDHQSFDEFLQDAIGFDMLAGEMFYNHQGISGRVKNAPLSISVLPPKLVNIIAGDNLREIKEFRWVPEDKVIDPKEILYVKSWNPLFYESSTYLRGLSPLVGFLLSLQGSNEGQAAMAKTYQFQGPPVVVFNDDDKGTEMDENAVNLLKEQFSRYSTNRLKGQIMVTDSKLGKLDLGLSPVDLAILDSELASRQNICNAYQFDSLLLGNTSGRSGTAAELESARKRAFLDAVLPRLTKVKNALNEMLNTASAGYYIDFDYSGLPELQEDMQKQADTLDKMPYVKWKEKRAFTGWDEDKENENQAVLNDYMIPNNVKPFSMLVKSEEARNKPRETPPPAVVPPKQ